MGWKENSVMYWQDGGTWRRISDHNRSPLDISFERFGSDERMVNATMRRHSIAKKRTISVDWTMLPSLTSSNFNGMIGQSTVDAGWAGEDMENFYKNTDGAFKIKLRKGRDEAKAVTDGTIEEMTVMFTSFSKTIVKRSVFCDFWDLSLELVEV